MRSSVETGSNTISAPDKKVSGVPVAGPMFYFYKSLSYAMCVAIGVAVAMTGVLLRAEEPELTEDQGPTDRDPIEISADFSHDWIRADDVHVFTLRGNCRVEQGDVHLRAQKIVAWHQKSSARDHVTVYLEGAVRLERPGSTRSQPTLLLKLVTQSGLNLHFRRRLTETAPIDDPLLRRARNRRDASPRSTLEPTQFVVPSDDASDGPGIRSVQVPSPTGDFRRIRISPRSVIPFDVHSEKSTDTTPPEQITVLTGGINLLVDGVEQFGTVDLSADRMVIWNRATDQQLFQEGVETIQARDAPFQVYLEGNIEIRQGTKLIRAERAYYDAREDRALLIDAELKAFLGDQGGLVRIRAEKIRQLSQKSFHAQQAWVSSSPFGKPGYRFQATDIFLESRYSTPWIGPGVEPWDATTGAPLVDEVPWVTSLNNAFLINDYPLLYAPYLSGPADEPNLPIRRVNIEQDRIFGGQIRTAWDGFRIFGLDAPRGVRWNLLADYLTSRGPAIGTSGDYKGSSLFGMPGTYSGEGLAYYIYDDGEDNLGADRRNLALGHRNRGRVLLRHRQDLRANVQLFGEIGFLSDRNFLEQYYENEFDESKDNETLLYLKQQMDNWTWTGLVRPQVNNFDNTTEWLPRGDLYVLSQSLFGGRLTWSSHTSVGYARLRPAEPPSDPTADLFTPLPFLAPADGSVLMSRHELDLPLQLGPVHFVPYIMGEGAHWGEDATGADIDRLVGSAGVRGNVMFWRVFPYVGSRVFNLNGLAHKMVFDVDYSITDSSRGLDTIPQYNEFDDNAQERFRSRFLTNTFSGTLPATFEPRFYAVRSGAGRSVTVPYYELVDDQQVFRLAWRHRLQTKVGPPERLRIKDWMTLDLEASYFPDPGRDNFGEPFGLIGGRYSWLVGDRTSLLANAYYDLFDEAQQLWNVGVLTHRTTRGSAYLGLRQVRGAGMDSQILTASASYAMSPKWIATAGTAYDLGESRNAGQSLTITRVGLDFLIHVGATFDESKGNAGIGISIEPRFGQLGASSSQLSSLLQTP